MLRAILALWMMLLPLAAQAQLRASDGVAALDAGDVARAQEIWQALAARGDALAQYNLAILLIDDLDQAMPLLDAAAHQGHAPAALVLADIHAAQGDWAAAKPLYARAAEAGLAPAQRAKALILDQGLAGPADRARAAQFYHKAALQGDMQAAFAYGALLAENGQDAQAVAWFEQAAGAGHLDAKFNLARALAKGVGVAQDHSAARALYFRAAQAGHGAAAYNLALMQARGQGGEQSFRHALAWAVIAAQTPYQPAVALVAALREVMSESAQHDAMTRIAACLSPDTAQTCR